MTKQLFNGVYILQTTNAKHVWEIPYYPQLYVPKSELQASSKSTGLSITEGEAVKSEDGKHVGDIWTLKVGDRSTDKVIAFSDDLAGKAEQLAGLVKVDFGSIDQWFEEVRTNRRRSCADNPLLILLLFLPGHSDICTSQRPVRPNAYR